MAMLKQQYIIIIVKEPFAVTSNWIWASSFSVIFCFLPFCCSTKIEKEKREHAKQHGMIRTEITGAEIAEEMEKERRIFQLQMCEVCGLVKIKTFCLFTSCFTKRS